MGNWWRGVSSEKLAECERNLMRINGIPEDAYTIRNVQLGDQDGSEHYIHEISVNPTREDLPELVLIHGYLSGGMQFCKMMPLLRNYFRVTTIDLLGMGSSGRPQDLELTSFESSLAVFLDSIHKWTQLKGIGQNGDKFFLLGHSLGGLISAHYALKYPDQIEKLILMSAVGVQEKPANLQQEKFLSERQSSASRYGAKWIANSWSSFSFSPADLYRMVGYSQAKRMVRTGIMRRIRDGVFTDEEKACFIEWVVQNGMRRKSSEICVYTLLAPLAYSDHPLCHKLPDLQMPVAFMYGEHDWMSREVADKLVADGKVEGEVFLTRASGHHLYAEAAPECVSAVLKFALGEQALSEFTASLQ